jgi:hypothetical protein
MMADPVAGSAPVFRPVEVGPASFVLADRLARCVFSYKEEREAPAPDLWRFKWTNDRTPAAVRIDLAPLEPDPVKLQVPTIVAPFRPTRHAMTLYRD